ncbi:MAG: phage tail sheath family protein [Bacteroidia bacterium]|nr:phage tail sheath family protein [Bacteroidia bacterium]
MSDFKKTPGVYIEERSVFGNSVVPVPTAIPAFIGYTEKTDYDGKSITNQLIKISSLVDYLNLFGLGNTPKYAVTEVKKPEDGFDLRINNKMYAVGLPEGSTTFYTYNLIRLFYANGGGDAYIVSLGGYDSTPDKDKFMAGVELLKKEPEITMILAPDALNLASGDYYDIMNTALEQCLEMKSRITMIDIHDGKTTPENDPINFEKNVFDAFRDKVPSNPETASYGITYYPWLDTNVVQDSEIGSNLLSVDLSSVLPTDEGTTKAITELTDAYSSGKNIISKENQLKTKSGDYKKLLAEVKKKINLLPPCAGMAGVYAKVDDQRGVWKAPANLGLNSVLKPHVKIDNHMQEGMNVPLDGKAINAIRSFQGRGAAWIWGARTLDGNSNDWRYINVRRLFLFLEESIKQATFPFVFEPNDANTWNTLSSMISSFLNTVWKAGGLVGNTPEQAYQVLVGLGVTMTFQDILEGYLRVTVKVAPVRPAEFIVITFEQKVQEA